MLLLFSIVYALCAAICLAVYNNLVNKSTIKQSNMRELILNGAAGKIEAKYCHSSQQNAPAAIVLQPHPLYGGTMNNKVVYNTFHTFAKRNFSVLRFNFRGVGKSDGTFDHGVGELLDAAIALDWLGTQNPSASSYWIAGFSFGAWIAMQLLMRRPELSGFVAISPPAHSYDFSFLSPCPAPGIIIQGTSDTTVPESAVFSLYEKLEKQRNSDVEYFPITGANHFFDDHIDQLISAIDSYLEPRVNMQTVPKKVKKDRRRRQQGIINE